MDRFTKKDDHPSHKRIFCAIHAHRLTPKSEIGDTRFLGTEKVCKPHPLRHGLLQVMGVAAALLSPR